MQTQHPGISGKFVIRRQRRQKALCDLLGDLLEVLLDAAILRS